jgi:hypothetical protein
MAVNLMKYILQHSDLEAGESAALHCLTGKWLAETRSDRYSKLRQSFKDCQFVLGISVFFLGDTACKKEN